MSRTSNTFYVPVSDLGATYLEQQVNLMTTARSWRQITMTGQTAALTDSTGTSVKNVCTYSNKAAWDPVNKRVVIIGNGHGGATLRHVEYTESDNTWRFIGSVPDVQATHWFDLHTCNQSTGDIYRCDYGSGRTHRRNVGGTWAQIPQNPVSAGTYYGIVYSVDWWTGALSGFSGAQGAYIYFNPTANAGETGGQVSWYDPIGNNWFATTGQWLPAPPSGYEIDHVGAYSAAYNCFIGGGGQALVRRVFRVNSDKTVTEMPNSPVDYGIQKGRLVADPQSGKFLIYSYQGFYEYVPTGTGTWTLLTHPNSNGASLYDPRELNGQMVSVCAIPRHGAMNWGVTLWINMDNDISSSAYLYRHA